MAAIFQEDLKIIEVLPLEGMRLSADASLVIFDIAVKLSNGSFFDLEMQKVGYYFPGERCSCYTSDFIMRQYAKLKADFKEPNFNFRKMKPIHIITLMEHSSKEFREVSPSYIHKKIQYMDSGAKINFLENTTYISLDTFHEVVHNITTELDAWLTFLSSDAPADIVKLVNAYPEFAEYYKEICEFRTNPKELITMYSEALAIMDRNTVMYMCEDMKNTIKQQEETIAKNMAKIAETESALAETESVLAEKNASLAEKDASLAEKDATLAERDATLAERDATLAERDATLAERDATLAERDATLAEQNRIIEELKAQLAQYQS
ncbi:MAG: PD-(D/E)XK nuclease family transposase [Lachnospiraceae bacterium]|nr:PD-(D/E)XK nuclease family transposase [Lachnospiraceae bacterium]